MHWGGTYFIIIVLNIFGFRSLLGRFASSFGADVYLGPEPRQFSKQIEPLRIKLQAVNLHFRYLLTVTNCRKWKTELCHVFRWTFLAGRVWKPPEKNEIYYYSWISLFFFNVTKWNRKKKFKFLQIKTFIVASRLTRLIVRTIHIHLLPLFNFWYCTKVSLAQCQWKYCKPILKCCDAEKNIRGKRECVDEGWEALLSRFSNAVTIYSKSHLSLTRVI